MIQITLLLLLSFFIRLIKIQDYLFFGFEQGRDLQIIQRIWQFKDFVLVGPSTSIGGLFHGAWYYYLLSLPLGLTSGNPLAASIFLIALSSFLPSVMYLLIKDMLNSKTWGLVGGFVTIFSYEYILYSRWLSNVSPAPLFIALAFLFLWKYSKKNLTGYFLLFILSAGLAALFQMILAAQFILVLILVLALRQIKIPSLKTTILSMIVLLVIFTPHMIFNFRNQNIMISSLVRFAFAKDLNQTGDLLNSLSPYFLQMQSHFRSSLVNVDFLPIQLVVFISILSALYIGFKKNKQLILFSLIWLAMSLPIIFISPGNPQYYVGIGLAWIILFVLSLKTFWENRKIKIISILLGLMFLVGVVVSVNNLLSNKDVFFRTVQDDLNYSDQKRVLDYIHNDAANNPYRLVSFTIPSLQPEAWDYLKQYFYPGDPQENAKFIYIVIEKHVYPVWENKWIQDLGPTELVEEKNFGLLRVQKRIKIDTNNK